MEPNYTYTASASWASNHQALVKAENGIAQTLDFSVPPEFGGEPDYWTPEHLLLASVASCLVATFRGMSKKSKLEFPSINVNVRGIIEKQDGYLCFTRIILHPEVLIEREEDRERTNLLLEKAERACLIARSLSAEVVLEAKVTVEALLPA
jgi:peroxiredoxin-like protein